MRSAQPVLPRLIPLANSSTFPECSQNSSPVAIPVTLETASPSRPAPWSPCFQSTSMYSASSSGTAGSNPKTNPIKSLSLLVFTLIFPVNSVLKELNGATYTAGSPLISCSTVRLSGAKTQSGDA